MNFQIATKVIKSAKLYVWHILIPLIQWFSFQTYGIFNPYFQNNQYFKKMECK